MSLIPLLRRHAMAAWRQRWPALLVAWIVCGVGWFGVQLLPSRYESTARVYADADAILSLLLRGIAIDSTPSGQVEVLQRTLLSRPNLDRVISRTDLELRVDTPEEREALMLSLAKSIRITTQTRNLFTIDYRDQNPRIARDVVQATLTLFIEAATANDRAQMESARSFVAQQITSYEAQLRQAENRRAEFQARYLDILPSEALGGSSRLEAARARVVQVQGELQDARARRAIIEQQIAATPAVLPGEGGGGGRLAEAERALRELRLRLTDQHPDVVAARGMVAELRAGGAAARGDGAARGSAARANPLLEQLRVRMVDVDAQIASLERQERTGQAEVERLDAIARSEPEVLAQQQNINRDYTVLRRNYEELLARRESLQIAGAARNSSDRVRLEVVDPPAIPLQPVAPPRLLLFAAVLLAGIGAGVLTALLLSRLDRAFYTVEELRGLGLPVLGGVSAPPGPWRVGPALAFAGGFALLFVGFGAVVAGVPGLIVKLVA
jgi:polysaccharide chain length determinant protein (PEP-CTERM system associated)